jgi:hypothetical protein
LSKRKHIGFKTKLAAAICAILKIPHEHQLLLTEEQVLSLVAWDHWPRRHADGGTSEFYNLMPRSIMAHREKTKTVDMPALAKSRRIRQLQADHVAVMDAKTSGDTVSPIRHKRKIASRGFDRGHRPIRSRPFAKT